MRAAGNWTKTCRENVERGLRDDHGRGRVECDNGSERGELDKQTPVFIDGGCGVLRTGIEKSHFDHRVDGENAVRHHQRQMRSDGPSDKNLRVPNVGR